MASPSLQQELYRPFLRALPISGASVAVMMSSGPPISLCASDAMAARIDELHFELGEGPQWSAARTGTMVMIADVAAHDHDDWPVFKAGLSGLQIHSLFCVPMRMEAETIGVATLHSIDRLELTRGQQATALSIATDIAGEAAEQAIRSAINDTEVASRASPTLRREVHHATGIMIVQLNTTAEIAYARLQAYSFANGRSVLDVARDVVSGQISFTEKASE